MSSRLDWARERPFFKEQSKDQDQKQQKGSAGKSNCHQAYYLHLVPGTHLVEQTEPCQLSSGLHRHTTAYTMAGTYTNKCNKNKNYKETAEVWLPSTVSVLTDLSL